DSPLLKAVQYDGDIQMPPNGKLSDGEIAVVKQWIALGMPWPEGTDEGSSSGIRESGEITEADRRFWSFVPPRRHALPHVAKAEQSRGPIDHFVLQQLEAEQLEPLAEADRATLLRRLSIDLLGLPPSLDSVHEFVADDSPDAVSRMLDLMLASPHYGERWGRHWLDVARYAEDQAHSFQARMYHSGYQYRDWVVRSLNHDLPYNQFVFDQVAGDLRAEGDRLASLPGLGYFALGPVYYADAGCAPKAQADEIDDRIDTLARGFLGLTVSCARCHDHKFDPITMRDYYGLAGVFASTKYDELPLVPEDVVKRFNAATAHMQQQEKTLDEFQNAASRAKSESWAPQFARFATAGWQLKNRRHADAKAPVTPLAQERNLPEFMIESFVKFLSSDQVAKSAIWAEWQKAVEGQDTTRDWSTDPAAVEKVNAVAMALQGRLESALARRKELEDQYTKAMAEATDEEAKKKVARMPLEKEHEEVLKELAHDGKAPLFVPREQLEKLLDEQPRQQLAEHKAELERRKQAIGPKYPVAHGLAEGEIKNVKIHLRGNHATLGDEAPRRFLEVLSAKEGGLFSQGSGRRELAESLASATNPLTARVMVNRVWANHFGQGIVGTPSNFGLLGQRPSHPELLDDLAVRFVESGWSIKWLHRQILLSSTWQRGSNHSAEQFDKDPENRLLWRMNRRRLDIEAWRDSVLSAVGSLDHRLGGAPMDLNDGNHRRRTLYSKISRHELDSMLRLFDFPDPNLTSERRVITTVPMQQLFVLNSEFMVRQAQTLVARVDRDGTQDPVGRVRMMYEIVLGREPTDRERQVAERFLATATEEKNARLTPWVQWAQLLLSTNEFVFLD
ncbi:MAG: hypothetical protein RIS70_4428, partial [Planctomycetota bacterium]